MPFCGSCGQSNPDTSQFCAKCGTTITASTQASSQTKAEKVLLDEAGFFVSNARFIHNMQTYAMSGVTSVNQYFEQPSRKWPIILMIFSGLGSLQGLTMFRPNNGLGFAAIFPEAFFLALFLLGLWLYRKKVPVYGVVLHSASGQHRAADCTDRMFIERIIAALNQAIILRG